MLCNSCANELNRQCYCKRTVYQMVEQQGGRIIYEPGLKQCGAYRYAPPEEKEALRREAEWYQRLKAVDFNVDELLRKKEA